MGFLLRTKQFFRREKEFIQNLAKKADIHNKYSRRYLYVEIIVNMVCELVKFVN